MTLRKLVAYPAGRVCCLSGAPRDTPRNWEAKRIESIRFSTLFTDHGLFDIRRPTARAVATGQACCSSAGSGPWSAVGLPCLAFIPVCSYIFLGTQHS